MHDYLARKAAGNATVRIEEGDLNRPSMLCVCVAEFDPLTGEKTMRDNLVTPEQIDHQLKQLNEQIGRLKDQREDLTALKADIDTLMSKE